MLLALKSQDAHRVGHPTASHFAARREPEELDPGLGGTVMAAVDDEAEPTRLPAGRELEEIQLVAIGRQDSVLRRIRRVVVAESAGNATDREDDVVVVV